MSIKAFGKNAVIYSIGTIAARLAMFIVIPIYTHYLTLQEYGLLSILLLTLQLLSTFIDFGLLISLMRFVPEYSHQNKEGELIGSALLLNFLSGILIVIVSILILPFIFQKFLNVNNSFYLILLTSSAAAAQSVGINFISYFRAKDDPKWYTILGSLSALFILLLAFLFIVILKLGIEGALFSYLLSYSIITIITLIKISLKLTFSFSFKTFRTLVNYGFPLIFARSGNLIVGLIAVSFLGYFVNIAEVGIYNLGLKIASIMNLVLVLPFQLALEPYVFNNIESENIKSNLAKITTYLFFTFYVFSFLLIFVSPYLIQLIATPEYSKSYYIIVFLLPISLFQGFSYLGQSQLHVNKKSKTTGTIVGLMSIFSLLVSYLLIKSMGSVGILLSMNIYYFFTSILLFYYGQQEFPIKLEKVRLLILSLVYLFVFVFLIIFESTSSFLYYFTMPFILLIIMLGFFKLGFFDKKEKKVLMTLINKFIFNKQLEQ